MQLDRPVLRLNAFRVQNRLGMSGTLFFRYLTYGLFSCILFVNYKAEVAL